MRRWLAILEAGFIVSLWWQTRFSLTELMGWSLPHSDIDYLIPFIYLSDLLFGSVLVAWALVEREGLAKWVKASRLSSWRMWLVQPGFWWALLLVSAAVSLGVNSVGLWGWYRWFKLMEAGLVGVWVWGRWGEGRWKLFGGLALGTLGLEALIMIAEWCRQASLGLQWLGEWRFDAKTPGIAKVEWRDAAWLRPMATFAHPNIAAGVLVCSLPLAAIWAKRVLNGQWRWLALSWLVLVLVAIGLSFSRAAWATLVLYGVWFGCLYWRSVWRATSVWRGAALLAVVAVSIWLVAPAVFERIMSLWSGDSWSWSIRGDLSQIAWQLWRGSPWLGIGLNNFTLHVPTLMGGALTWPQPVHSVWLLVLVELGWMGWLAWWGILLCVAVEIWSAWRTKVNPPLVISLVMVWVGVGLLSAIDHYWWTSQQGVLLMGGLVGGSWRLARQ